MAIRSTGYPYGGVPVLVDKMLGEAYPNVLRVAERMPDIIKIGDNVDNLLEGVDQVADDRQAVRGMLIDTQSTLEETIQARNTALSAKTDAEIAKGQAEDARDVVINARNRAEDVRVFGAKGDGVADDTVALQAAIDSTLPLFWSEGTYKISASLEGFWDREHTGYGKITRDGETFYITPKENELNIIYSGAPHSRTADGFTTDQAIHIDEAIKRIRKIGNKAQDGRWRIQMFGTTGASGVTLEGLPIFRNRLEIWGEAADDVSAVPTTVWDGTSSARMYAIRGDWNYNSANFFLHFKNIKFTNWNKSSNAGAIVIWGSGDVLSENIHVDSCSIGEWYRQNYVRVLGGKANNCQTWGVGIQYGASGNVGNLSGKGKVFTNCSTGVSIGRNTTAYIQGCDLSGDTLIEVNRNSRIRTQGNTYRAWTKCVVDASLVGVWTVDNGQGDPDTYLQIPSGTAPVMLCGSGSIHQHLQRFSGNTHWINATGSSCSISGTTAPTLLSTVAGVTPGEWIPARVPAWWAYSPSARLIVKLFMSHVAPHAGGVLELKGGGASASLLLAKLTVAPSGSSQAGWVTMEFMTRGSFSAGRYFSEYKSNGGNVVTWGSTGNLDNSLIRDAAEDTLIYRLYWTPNDSSDTVLFTDMHSYIEV